jgi:hypothetical protein
MWTSKLSVSFSIGEKDCRVEFVNSHPMMISIFMKYLRAKNIQDDEVECGAHWKKVTSLDDSNFISTVVKHPAFPENRCLTAP